MLWLASNLSKQSETLQGIYLYVVKFVGKVLAVTFMFWFSHIWWQEALSMVLVQITPKCDSMDVVGCINPLQTN
jgi:hypothetical protein